MIKEFVVGCDCNLGFFGGDHTCLPLPQGVVNLHKVEKEELVCEEVGAESSLLLNHGTKVKGGAGKNEER